MKRSPSDTAGEIRTIYHFYLMVQLFSVAATAQ